MRQLLYKKNRRFSLRQCILLPACSAFLLFLISPHQTLNAQQITVSGTITSAEDGQPLIGASILEVNSSNGTLSDIVGHYRITVGDSATLRFSYTGFEPQDIPVQGRTTIDVVLATGSEILQDVVVTGYRREIRSDVATAIATVKGEDIQKLVVTGIDQALQGQAPGLQVTQVSGAPGDDIAVRIRGAGTLGNNNPLFIIDGVPTTGNINMFSTRDIESIEVLKDGAAAAIYGARAANGVILITTKKGKAGLTRFSLDVSAGYSEAYRLPELLNAREYLTIRNEAINNANVLREPARQLDTFDLAILDTLPDINWLNEVFRPAPLQRYSLSASGGGKNNSYFIQGEYLDQQGVFRGQGFKKYGLRFNGEAGGKWLKIGNSISFSFTDRKVINSTGDGYGPGNELSGIRYTLIAAPVFRPYRADGSYYNTSSDFGDPMLYGDGNANPLAFIDATDWTLQRSRLFGSIFAEATILPGLALRTTLGGDLLFENEKLFKERLSQAIYDPSSLNEGRVFDRNLIWNNVLDFQRTFARRHRVAALLGMEAIQNQTNYLGASASNFLRTDDDFRYLSASVAEEIQDQGVSGIVTEWALLSWFGQLGYTFDNRYVINGSLRRDGSSRFGPNHRYGIFPGVSAAWNVSNEPFFSRVKFISALKLRASWGQLGNQDIGLYPFASRVVVGQHVYDFGGQITNGAQIVETGNSNVKWESTTQLDVGLDFSVWGDRLSFIGDWYRKTTDDILVRVPIPQSGGDQNPPYVNAGKVENEGLELGLIFKNRNRGFHYTIGANISTVRNEVLSLAGGEPILGGFGLSDGAITKTEVGYPIGSFYLYKMEGIFQNQAEIDAAPFQTDDTRPGDVRFADLNGDNKIDDMDRAHIGNPFPDFIYGLNLGLEWKNFDLSVLAQGVQGNDVYFLYGNFAYETQARGFNSYRDILDRWTPSNPSNTVPKVSVDDRNGNRRLSTRFLYDGSYFRFRNITLGYNFKSLIRTEAIGGLRLYLTAQNPFTFTKYPGLDPEIQANTNDTRGLNLTSDLAVGIDWGTVPAPRTFIVGATMDF